MLGSLGQGPLTEPLAAAVKRPSDMIGSYLVTVSISIGAERDSVV
jgi:hypothetical protein